MSRLEELKALGSVTLIQLGVFLVTGFGLNFVMASAAPEWPHRTALAIAMASVSAVVTGIALRPTQKQRLSVVDEEEYPARRRRG